MSSLHDPEAPNANPRDADILLAEGFRILDFGGGTYIGHVKDSTPTPDDANASPQTSSSVGDKGNARVVPHGFGYLVLPDLSQHSGDFRDGRAHGPGVLIKPDGSEREGTWDRNRRVGEFRMTKGDGTRWTERYDQETGKIKARKRRDEEQDPAGSPAVICWACGGLFRREGLADNPYACRSHRGTFHRKNPGDRNDDDPCQEGVWTCCSRPNRGAPGCQFAAHNLNH